MSSTEPPPKRSRPSNGLSLEEEVVRKSLSIFSPKLLQEKEHIARDYLKAKPYPHAVLDPVFRDGFAEKVLHEVKHNLKAKFKESDLFRVYQSIDLANLSPDSDTSLKDKMPALMTLRESLYSSDWRHCMEQMCNLPHGTLTDQVDCAVNCHDKGCHLLCHDDVIGTRKVSYILYLTDPVPDWTDDDGGRLELYESITEVVTVESESGVQTSVSTKVPGVTPVKTVLPKFNSLAFFVVEPGVSFHSVQEVFCDRPRLSIQGWYHAKQVPKDMEHASLNQLKSLAWQDSVEEFIPMAMMNSNQDEGDTLSKKDIEFLSRYINKTYLRSDYLKEISERFEEESSVQLRHFFNEEWESKISNYLKEDDAKCSLGRDGPVLDYSVGVSDDWVLVGPAHKQRYLEYVGEAKKDGKTSGSLLKYLKETVMQSVAFGKLLKSFTSLGMPLGYRGKVRRFRPGLDYTIAHYGILTKKAVLDATLCFVAGKGDQSIGDENDHDDDIIWQSDDKGGFECYIEADDDEDKEQGGGKKKEAEDEYDEDDDTKLLSVSASNNTLSLVYRDPGTMRFVKYLGIGAPSSRWDLSMEYEVEEDENDEVSENDRGEDNESGNDDVGF